MELEGARVIQQREEKSEEVAGKRGDTCCCPAETPYLISTLY